jgi:hypothetical protein
MTIEQLIIKTLDKIASIGDSCVRIKKHTDDYSIPQIGAVILVIGAFVLLLMICLMRMSYLSSLNH